MDIHTATEVAYKNGYKDGVKHAEINMEYEKAKAAAYRNGYGQGLIDAVKHGHWIMHEDELGLSCECSMCHIETCGDTPYCPRCGTKMNGRRYPMDTKLMKKEASEFWANFWGWVAEEGSHYVEKDKD